MWPVSVSRGWAGGGGGENYSCRSSRSPGRKRIERIYNNGADKLAIAGADLHRSPLEFVHKARRRREIAWMIQDTVTRILSARASLQKVDPDWTYTTLQIERFNRGESTEMPCGEDQSEETHSTTATPSTKRTAIMLHSTSALIWTTHWCIKQERKGAEEAAEEDADHQQPHLLPKWRNAVQGLDPAALWDHRKEILPAYQWDELDNLEEPIKGTMTAKLNRQISGEHTTWIYGLTLFEPPCLVLECFAMEQKTRSWYYLA